MARKRKYEKNNYQDAAEMREYDKGFKAGEAKKTGRPGRLKENAYDKSRTTVPVYTGAKSSNDPNWYALNPTLLKDVANVTFSYPLGYSWDEGMANTWTGNNLVKGEDTIPPVNIPGILVFYTAPAIGPASDARDPITVATDTEFNFVRHQTSGSSRYEAPDLGMYQLALDSAYSYYSFLVRAYGVMTNFSVMNKYEPKTVIEAMGIDYDSVSKNLADFRAMINFFANKLGQFCVPLDIAYIKRHVWMYSNIYMDAESFKSQYYFYTPRGFYIYNEASGEIGVTTTLTYTDLPYFTNNTLMDLETLSDFGDTILDPVVRSQDCMFISADILRAFGAGNLYKVAPISETYHISPVFDKEVLMQMENSYIYNATKYTSVITENADINAGFITAKYQLHMPSLTPANTALNWVSKLPIAALTQRKKLMLNFHMDSVSPDDIMVATRLSSLGVKNISSTSQANLFICEPANIGSDIILNASVIYEPDYQFGYSSWDLASKNVQIIDTYTDHSNTVADFRRLMQSVSLLASFDWHPRVDVTSIIGYIQGDASGATQYYADTSAPIWDTDNFTFITSQELDNLNRVALISMLACRSMGAFNLTV